MKVNDVNQMEAFTYQNIDTKSDSFAETADEYVVSGVVLMKGDMFYQGDFVPWSSIQAAFSSISGSQIHDINHKGTGYVMSNGQMIEPDINFIVGYQNNFLLDDMNKALKMDVHILKSSPMANAWKAYYDICQKASRMPNVSSYGYKRSSIIKACDAMANYASYGLKKDDMIRCVSYIDIQAGSTVYRGACNDKDGCGMPVHHCECVGEHAVDANRLSYLRSRMNEIGGN